MVLKFLANVQDTHVLRFVAISWSNSLHFLSEQFPSLLFHVWCALRIPNFMRYPHNVCILAKCLHAPPVTLLQHWEDQSENKLMMHIFLVLCLKVYWDQDIFNCIAAPILFHTAPTTTDAFIIQWDELFYSLFISVHVLCYHPSCHSCFHLTTILQFLVQRFCLSSNKGNSHLANIISDIITVNVGGAVMKLSAISIYFWTNFCNWNFCYLCSYSLYSISVLCSL